MFSMFSMTCEIHNLLVLLSPTFTLTLFTFRKLWDAEKGIELQTFAHKHIVKSVDFNRQGTLLLTGSNEKLLRIFDLGKPEAG
jgi:WD40 repeat protein